MLEIINRQLEKTPPLTKEIIDEMKRVKLEVYDIPLEQIEAELGNVKPGDKKVYAIKEREINLTDTEFENAPGITKKLEVLTFWSFQIEEFLLNYEYVDTLPDGLVMRVKDKIKRS